MSAPEADRPALRIVRGDPTPEEPPRRGRWSDPAWQHGTTRYPGPGAWASSFR
jgi:hypothetical protein